MKLQVVTLLLRGQALWRLASGLALSALVRSPERSCLQAFLGPSLARLTRLRDRCILQCLAPFPGFPGLLARIGSHGVTLLASFMRLSWIPRG